MEAVKVFLDWLKAFIQQLAPTLAVLLWDYEQEQIAQAKSEKEIAELALQKEKNNEKVDSENANKSDLDIVDDAIKRSKSGHGQ